MVLLLLLVRIDVDDGVGIRRGGERGNTFPNSEGSSDFGQGLGIALRIEAGLSILFGAHDVSPFGLSVYRHPIN